VTIHLVTRTIVVVLNIGIDTLYTETGGGKLYDQDIPGKFTMSVWDLRNECATKRTLLC
jgi:hypothetical protein